MVRKATESVRRANQANADLNDLFEVVNPKVPLQPQDVDKMRELVTLGIRPTTDEAKLNLNEKRYLAWLETQHDYWIGVQCITLKIGADLRYTPDFWALDKQGLRSIDTKGAHTWEDSIVKIKVSARMFPWIRFLLAKAQGELWEHVEIKP